MIISTGEVARELGITGQTVRDWSTVLLLKPSRSRGGWRSYSPEQIVLLKQFKFLVKTEGYTLAGAKKVLYGRG